MDLKEEINERDEVIKYLKEQMNQLTGVEVEFPSHWERYQDRKPIHQDNLANQPEKTFILAVQELELPPPIVRQKKSARPGATAQNSPEKPAAARIDPRNPKHMVESIVLNDYKARKFNKETFRELLTGMKSLPKLKSLEIQRNGIGDTYLVEFEEMIRIKNLRRIDISRNEIAKIGITKICEILRNADNKHIEWLDISGNNYFSETQAMNALATVLRDQPQLYHASVSVSGQPGESIVRNLVSVKKIKSLGLPGSQLTTHAIAVIQKEMMAKKNMCQLTCLNLTNCFLKAKQISLLSEALKVNKSLVKLNLSSNGLNSTCGGYLANSLTLNQSLYILDLTGNELLDEFIDLLICALRENETLFECNITGNPFTTIGAHLLYRAVTRGEISVQSFGSLDTNGFIDISTRVNLKGALGFESEEYAILRPIEETNQRIEDYLPWNFSDETA